MTQPFNFPKEKTLCTFCGRTKVGVNKQRLPVCYEHKQTLRRYSRYEAIKIYEEVLAGFRKQFPQTFWRINGKHHAKILLRYLIEEKLGLKDLQQFPSVFGHKFILKYRLHSPLRQTGFLSLYELIDYTYPGRFKPWQMEVVPDGYWKQKKHRIAAVRWLVHEHFRIRRLEDIPKKVTAASFYQNRIGSLIVYYQNGYFDAIEETYPRRFKPWEFTIISHGYWQGKKGKEHAQEALRWLVEKKLKIPVNEIPLRLSREIMAVHGFKSIFKVHYHSLWNLVDDAYPNRFKPWDFEVVPAGYWHGEQGKVRAREATRWLIEEKLKISLSQIPHVVMQETFEKNRLGSVIRKCCLSFYGAIENAYPGRFKPWEFKAVPKGYWHGEQGKVHTREATRWLIEERLKIPVSQIPKRITRETFDKNRLKAMLELSHLSFYRAIENAYPNRFKPWEFKRAPDGYWHGEQGKVHVREATRWLIEEKLKISPSQIPRVVTSQTFRKNRLQGMIDCCGLSFHEIIETAYPGRFKPKDFAKGRRIRR